VFLIVRQFRDSFWRERCQGKAIVGFPPSGGDCGRQPAKAGTPTAKMPFWQSAGKP
jgi:hypothetical protein